MAPWLYTNFRGSSNRRHWRRANLITQPKAYCCNTRENGGALLLSTFPPTCVFRNVFLFFFCCCCCCYCCSLAPIAPFFLLHFSLSLLPFRLYTPWSVYYGIYPHSLIVGKVEGPILYSSSSYLFPRCPSFFVGLRHTLVSSSPFLASINNRERERERKTQAAHDS